MAEFATVQLRYAEAAAVETAVIAHFAQAVRPTVRPLPDDLVVRRRYATCGRLKRLWPRRERKLVGGSGHG